MLLQNYKITLYYSTANIFRQGRWSEILLKDVMLWIWYTVFEVENTLILWYYKGDHILNPNSTGKHDYYLDKYGNPVAKNSKASHILP